MGPKLTFYFDGSGFLNHTTSHILFRYNKFKNVFFVYCIMRQQFFFCSEICLNPNPDPWLIMDPAKKLDPIGSGSVTLPKLIKLRILVNLTWSCPEEVLDVNVCVETWNWKSQRSQMRQKQLQFRMFSSKRKWGFKGWVKGGGEKNIWRTF